MLPNNSNVLLAAEQAAALARSRSRSCRATRSRPGSRRWSPSTAGTLRRRERGGDAGGRSRAVDTGEVTIASRDVELNGVSIHKGDWLGLARRRAGRGRRRLRRGRGRRRRPAPAGGPRELLTLLVGEDGPPLDGLLERIRRAHPERRGRRPARRAAALSAPPFGRVDSLRPWGGRSGSSSSRTTRSFARRSSSCSACARTSRSSPRSATGAPRSTPRGSYQPDVVLMDYRLPGLDGVQATAAVREARPGVAVVCLTASANAREIEALLRGRRRRLPDEGPGARRHRRTRSTAAGRAREPHRREHRDRPRLDRRLPRRAASASRTGASCRCTSTSATRASATAST